MPAISIPVQCQPSPSHDNTSIIPSHLNAHANASGLPHQHHPQPSLCQHQRQVSTTPSRLNNKTFSTYSPRKCNKTLLGKLPWSLHGQTGPGSMHTNVISKFPNFGGLCPHNFWVQSVHIHTQTWVFWCYISAHPDTTSKHEHSAPSQGL